MLLLIKKCSDSTATNYVRLQVVDVDNGLHDIFSFFASFGICCSKQERDPCSHCIPHLLACPGNAYVFERQIM